MNAIQKAIDNEDVDALCQSFFNKQPTPKQAEIIREIAFRKNLRLAITAYTRYGKTWAVGVGLALLIFLTKESLRIAVIAPRSNQAKEVRREFTGAVMESDKLKDRLDTNKSGASLKKEVSKKKLTFDDGDIEFELMTASSSSGLSTDESGGGAGSGLMSKGADVVVIDESCQIPHEVYKNYISRMLEHEESMLVELSNPWHKNNHFYQHWNSDHFKTIQVNYKEGEDEGRHSHDYFMEKKAEISEHEWTVLYESEFPDQIEQGVFKSSWVEEAIERDPFEFKDDEKIVGIDVAEKGKDKTVMTSIYQENNKVNVSSQDSWGNKETMQTVSKIDQKLKGYEYLCVDAIGVGSGVASRLKEKDYNVFAVKVSEKSQSDRFLNKKAQYYWKLRTLFEEGRISLSKDISGQLKKELSKIQYEITSSGKIKIIDPNKSPDYADCYDKKTEVLTKDGWKNFYNIGYKDRIATLNPDTKELEYQEPTNIIKENYEGKMYHIKDSQQLDIMVTPNHKLFVNTGDRRYGDFKLERARNVKGRNMLWKKDAKWEGKNKEKFVIPSAEKSKFHPNSNIDKSIAVDIDVWLRFLGYFLSEGHGTHKDRNTVTLACKPDSPIRNKMKEVCEQMPFNYNANKTGFIFYDKRLKEYLQKFGHSQDKYIPKKIKELKSEKLEILLEALMEGDGSRNQYYTTSERLRDDVMEIALKTGRSANYSIKHKEGAKGNYGTANYDLYTVAMQEKQTTPGINYKDYGAEDEWVEYNGKIYCVTVPNHIIMIRRNGKTCWSGNSLMLSCATHISTGSGSVKMM